MLGWSGPQHQLDLHSTGLQLLSAAWNERHNRLRQQSVSFSKSKVSAMSVLQAGAFSSPFYALGEETAIHTLGPMEAG